MPLILLSKKFFAKESLAGILIGQEVLPAVRPLVQTTSKDAPTIQGSTVCTHSLTISVHSKAASI